MKRIFTAAIALAATALAGVIPARATTFPALTAIYVASGASDIDLGALGMTTLINCTNLSGLTASVRYQFRAKNGTPLAGGTLALANLTSHMITSQGGAGLVGEIALPTGIFIGGNVEILSTQSAIYCSAMLVHATGLSNGNTTSGIALHMVRLNPHPGTVE